MRRIGSPGRSCSLEDFVELGLANDVERHLADHVRADEEHLAQVGIHERDVALAIEERGREEQLVHERRGGLEVGEQEREADDAVPDAPRRATAE
jgi:hypothetical protein